MIAVTSLLLLCVSIPALAFDPMYIELPQVHYVGNIAAAVKMNEYDFDEANEILGYPASQVEMNGFLGVAQYDVAMFRGIKYATAERFGNPEMVEVDEDGVVFAEHFGPSCPQPSQDYFENSDNYSEDCLFLDVYVPIKKTVLVTREPTYAGSTEYEWVSNDRYSLHKDLPILISFQGEDFTYVESKKVNARPLARYGSVIVVVVNYRTGVLGFLSSDDGEIKGNFGLRDQKVAIEWVKKYAKKFGGDPNSITLHGYSSGAESVGAQLYDPSNTKHLFQRVILQSGVSKHGTLFYNDKEAEANVQKHIMKKMKKMTGCKKDAVGCLKSLDVKDLISSAGALACERGDNRTFGPVKDEKYSCDSADLGQYEVMVGVVENEAGNWAGLLQANSTLYDSIMHLFKSNSYFHCAPERLVNFLDFEYRDNEDADSTKGVPKSFVKLLTDYNFVAPAIAFANKVSEAGGKTYFYQFAAEINSMEPGRPYFLEGRPLHGDDQNFLSGLPLLLTDLFRSTDRNVSANYIRMLSNFVHTGNPDVGPTNKPLRMPGWMPYTSDHMGTYVISDEPEMKYRKFARTIAVWTEAVSYLMSDDVCTGDKQVEVKTCMTPTTARSSWEESYREWKDIELPKWQERFQQASKAMGEKEECASNQ